MYVSGGSGGRENVAFSLKPIPNGSRLHQLDPHEAVQVAPFGEICQKRFAGRANQQKDDKSGT